MRSSRLRMPELIEHASRIAAVSMGIALGVMPKANLSALAIFAWLTLANHLVGRVVAVICISFMLSSFTIPLVDSLGGIAIQFGPTQYLLELIETLPVVPWLRLNNPAVLGGLIIGETIFFGLLFGQFAISIRKMSKATETRAKVDSPVLAINDESGEELIDVSRQREAANIEPTVAPIEIPAPALTKHIAIHIPSFSSIDEIEHHESAIASALVEDYSNMEIHESTIEIIRFRSREEMLQPEMASIPPAIGSFTSTIPQIIAPIIKPNNMHNTESTSLLFANSNPSPNFAGPKSRMETGSLSPESGRVSVVIPSKSETEISIDFQNPVPANANVSVAATSGSAADLSDNGGYMEPSLSGEAASQPRDEALKYLLWHLSGEKSVAKIRERAS